MSSILVPTRRALLKATAASALAMPFVSRAWAARRSDRGISTRRINPGGPNPSRAVRNAAIGTDHGNAVGRRIETEGHRVRSRRGKVRRGAVELDFVHFHENGV